MKLVLPVEAMQQADRAAWTVSQIYWRCRGVRRARPNPSGGAADSTSPDATRRFGSDCDHDGSNDHHGARRPTGWRAFPLAIGMLLSVVAYQRTRCTV